MAIFFVRLIGDDDYGARSIAFECDSPTVAAATDRIHDKGYLSGFRCEWRWNDDRSERYIHKRTGMTLTNGRVVGIEEPFTGFVEPRDG